MKVIFASNAAAAAAATILMASYPTAANAQDVDTGITGVSPATVISVGDTYCVEGYVMDYYCIELGSLLDNPSVRTLEGPDEHSIHCLVDVGPCIGSEFEILTPPLAGSSTYRRSWRVTEDTKSTLVDLAREIGSCSTCVNGYSGDGQRTGLRAVMDATVVALRDGDVPPIVSVTAAFDTSTSTDSDSACQQYFPDLPLGSAVLLTTASDGGDSGGVAVDDIEDDSNVDTTTPNDTTPNDATPNVLADSPPTSSPTDNSAAAASVLKRAASMTGTVAAVVATLWI